MAKAKDLMGRSGAIGQGPVSPLSSLLAGPVDDHKAHAGPQHKGHDKTAGPSGGQSRGGGGKTPVGQRPKV